MLAQRLSLSLPTIKQLGWTPIDEASLEAWYKNRTGISTSGGISPLVTDWADSSPNSHDMTQGTVSEQPAYTAVGGILTFDSATTDNLQTASQISLTGDFTIGIKCFPTAFNNTIIADNTSANEFFKFTSTSQLRVKIGGTDKNLNLDAGAFDDDYLVITRVSNVLSLWQNGDLQSATQTLSGTALIDNIGVRKTDVNPYDGAIQEIVIFTSSYADLTTHVNNRLSTL